MVLALLLDMSFGAFCSIKVTILGNCMRFAGLLLLVHFLSFFFSILDAWIFQADLVLRVRSLSRPVVAELLLDADAFAGNDVIRWAPLPRVYPIPIQLQIAGDPEERRLV